MASRGALWVLLLGAPAGAAAQAGDEPAPPFGERVDVEVVNVDVVVTDRDGERVTDLARDDFELRIDGQPTVIEYFAGAKQARRDAAQPESSAAEAPTPTIEIDRPPGYLIVFVDQSALEIKTSDTIVEEIREFVLPRVAASQSVLVAAFVDSLRILTPATTDPARVEQALTELEKLRGRGTLLAGERRRLERDIRASMNPPMSEGNPARARLFLENERIRLQQEIEQFGEAALDRQRRGIAALGQWISALAALPGRKSVLLATGGISGSPTVFLTSLLEQKRNNPVRTEFSGSGSLASRGVELMVQFEAMVRAAQNARVAFYTISPRTPPVEQNTAIFGGLGSETAQAAPRDLALVEASSSVLRLAGATGGASFTVDGDLSDRLERVREDELAAYSLGFSTSETAGAGDHRIVVAVKREGLKVRHRESYRRRTLGERAEEALLAAATLGSTANPLGIALELGAPRALDKKGAGAIVPLLVRIPLRGLALLPVGEQREGKLAARVAIQDAKRSVRLGASAPLRVLVAEVDAESVATEYWAYRAEMRLAPGAQRIAVVIVDELAGVVATAESAIDVPKD